jgi:hypothetical protein
LEDQKKLRRWILGREIVKMWGGRNWLRIMFNDRLYLIIIMMLDLGILVPQSQLILAII